MSFTLSWNTAQRLIETQDGKTLKTWNLLPHGNSLLVMYSDGTRETIDAANITNFNGLTEHDQKLDALNAIPQSTFKDHPFGRVLFSMYKDLRPGVPENTMRDQLETWWTAANQ